MLLGPVQCCCSSLLVWTFLLIGCEESNPLVPEPEPEPFVEYRSWSVPERISALPDYGFPVSHRPTSISASGEQLHLMLSTRADTNQVYDRYNMAYLSFEGGTWTYRGEVADYGVPRSSASIALPDGRVHLFWAAVAEYEQDKFPEEIDATEVHHCLWEGTTCSVQSLFRVMYPVEYPFIRMSEALLDPAGDVHLMVKGFWGQHIVINSAGEVDITPIPEVGYPRIQQFNGQIYFLHVARPPEGFRGSNDLFHRRFINGRWTGPHHIFHDAGKQVHVPAYAIDSQGVHHIVFMVHNTVDTVSLTYMFSRDRGHSWSEPEVIYAQTSTFFRSPTLLVDSYDVLHVVWGHYGNLPEIDNFYAARQNGVWTEAERLFPEYRSITDAKTTIDEQDQIHVVWQDERDLYHARFE